MGIPTAKFLIRSLNGSSYVVLKQCADAVNACVSYRSGNLAELISGQINWLLLLNKGNVSIVYALFNVAVRIGEIVLRTAARLLWKQPLLDKGDT